MILDGSELARQADLPELVRFLLGTGCRIGEALVLSARTIADQLGHARISMTQDVYMGRRAVDQAAAAVLEGISPLGHDGDDQLSAVLSVVV